MSYRILALSLLLAGSVQAQQPMTVQRVQPATAAQPANTAQSTQATKVAKPDAVGPMVELDQKAINAQLTKRNKELRAQVVRLKEENASLHARIAEFTKPGGSEVRAFCPTGTTSRNTAGATANCARLGGYTCEAVSGLCRTSCQTTDMCAPGWTCDTAAQQCVNTSGG
jgi:hypothetical protein